MEYFVDEASIVRKIWGKGDIILFIFAGAAAEFALNKAVDWLYFTGNLPKDPLGRLFSTVGYARKIVFSPMEEAHKAIDTVQQIHAAVEQARGTKIPDWAYRDVLFMLVYYSIAAFELFERRLSEVEKEEVYDVFYRVGVRMGQQELPISYAAWLPVREEHLEQDLRRSVYTDDLFRQYKRHLGALRYRVLKEGQMLIVPERVGRLLGFRLFSLLRPVVWGYKVSRVLKMDSIIRGLVLPEAYKAEVEAMNVG